MVSGGNASSLPLVGGKPEPTIKELSSPGRRASKFPKLDVPEVKINHESLKKEKARLPEVSEHDLVCLLYTSPSPRDIPLSRMPSSA